jgi:hypothetical protein
VFLGVVWFLVVLAKYRLPRVYPGLDRTYRARPAFLPAVGALGAILVIAFTLVPVPGVEMSLQWPQEYLILIAWVVLGAILFVLTPPPKDPEEAFDEMAGPLAATLREAKREPHREPERAAVRG